MPSHTAYWALLLLPCMGWLLAVVSGMLHFDGMPTDKRAVRHELTWFDRHVFRTIAGRCGTSLCGLTATFSKRLWADAAWACVKLSCCLLKAATRRRSRNTQKSVPHRLLLFLSYNAEAGVEASFEQVWCELMFDCHMSKAAASVCVCVCMSVGVGVGVGVGVDVGVCSFGVCAQHMCIRVCVHAHVCACSACADLLP